MARRPQGKGTADPHRKRAGKPVMVEVETLTWGGRGLGRSGGKVIFVSKTVPGDKVLVHLDRAKTSYAEGHVEALLKASPHRVEPKCKFFSHCGGCQWLAVSYERQLAEKEAMVHSILRRHLPVEGVRPIVGAEPVHGYRHRGEFHIKPSGSGLRMGFMQDRSHRVVNVDRCRLFDLAFNRIYETLRRSLQRRPAGRAAERAVLSQSEDGEAFVLHIKGKEAISRGEAEELAALGRSLGFRGTLVTPTRHPERELAREGDVAVSYRLPGTREHGDLTLKADVRSFTQAHYAMNRLLVTEMLSMLALSAHERVLDLYGGIGNFSLPLACVCREVTAVEENPFAHADAKENALHNGLFSIRHVPGDALTRTMELASRSERFDAVVLDPPRTGARGLPGALAHLNPRRILYVSCGLPTLERDLGSFQEAGYVPAALQPVDCFPQTYGVEVLCLLERA